MEKIQPIQNSPYSQYTSGAATGFLATGILAASAFTIHSYVHSGTPILAGMLTASTLKEISIPFATGVFGFFGTIPSYGIIKSLIGMSNGSKWCRPLAYVISGTWGCATLGSARIIERLL